MSSYVTVNLPKLTLLSTGTNAPTIVIGSLDDATSLTLYMVSTAAATSTGAILFAQVTQYDPSIATSASSTGGQIQSTAFHVMSSLIFSTGTGLVTSSGCTITISPVNFKGFRLIGFSSGTVGENIAFVTKQVFV